jgi:PAS domain S-box-containing protein
LLDTGTPIYRNSRFTEYIGSCIDITEKKIIEERLRASEVRLIEAQRLAGVGSWELDVKSGRIEWSDEMFRTHGRQGSAPADFATFLTYVHPDDRHMLLDANRRLRSNDPVQVQSEYRIIRPGGEVRFVRSIAEAVRSAQGAPIRLLGATQDVTEQVRAAELLRESEERLKNAERVAHVGNWRWDIKSKRVFCSEELLRIFGNPQNGRLGYKQFIQMVVPQDRPPVVRWAKDCLSTKAANCLECQIAQPAGDVRTVRCIVEISRDEQGAPAHVFGTCQDITDFRRALEEAYARQKLETVGTLASGIAHDFNNLLGGVLAQVEVALAELAEGGHPEPELHRIRDSALQGSGIVRQLMIYAGQESENVELIDVSSVVKEMLDLLRVSVPKNAILVTDLDKNLPSVWASSAELRRIVMNLVTNASKAIGTREGRIEVRTTTVTVNQTAISTNISEGKYVRFEVTDSGVGMSAEMQARVFDPFFTTKSGGRGLGLAVVHGIVRNLRGTIEVRSQPGKGTTFAVLLPSAGVDAAVSDASATREDSGGLSDHESAVLLVEDEDPLRQAVAKMLRRAGFQVFEAADGSAAIDLIRAKHARIDVVLLDVTIPGASSREVAAAVAEVRPDSKVILSSAYSEEMVMTLLSPSLFHGFIRKPFRLGDLMQTLRGVVPS